MAELALIYERAEGTATRQFAKRADGVWFTRRVEIVHRRTFKTVTRWLAADSAPDPGTLRQNAKQKARLPKHSVPAPPDAVLAWHFVANTLRYGEPIPADGVELRHPDHEPLTICRKGLHASMELRDALRYAPGLTLCRVECREIGQRHSDKFVCRSRTILWRVNAVPILIAWASRCASDVLPLWKAPDVVKAFLAGDHTLAAYAANAASAAANAASAAAYAARAASAAANAASAAADAASAAANAADAAADAAAYTAAYAARAADAAAYTAADAADAVARYNGWFVEMVTAAHDEQEGKHNG